MLRDEVLNTKSRNSSDRTKDGNAVKSGPTDRQGKIQ